MKYLKISSYRQLLKGYAQYVYPLAIVVSVGMSLCKPADMMAQTNATYVNNIRTLETKVNGKWGEPPVILLNSGQYIEISFDDLQHDYVRYTFTITHCNSDWTQSELYSGDYLRRLNSFDVIENYTPSMNTEMLYNHYTFRLPDKEHQLLVSGNYRIDIYDNDDDDKLVATACFSIVEHGVGIGIKISPNTDIDSYQTHQQVEFEINHKTYPTSNPEAEFKPIVLQNRRWDTHVENLKPTYIRNGTLVYNHNTSLIFNAGNEYRRFEILDEYVPTMRVDHMRYTDDYYHADIMEDQIRKNYKYDEDQNGRFLIRNSDNVDNDTESDYFITHFTLKMPQLAGGNVYLNGDLTYNQYADDYMMEYNLIDHQYEIALPLKQGSYNYQYLFVREGNQYGETLQVEGDYFQTENEYYVYVYHRAFGGRYDRLVGFQSKKFKGNNN